MRGLYEWGDPTGVAANRISGTRIWDAWSIYHNVVLIPQRFPVPRRAEDFELVVLQLLRRHWSRPNVQLFGRRGEAQFGIDILDLSGEAPNIAIQCKLRNADKNLSLQEIRMEVKRVRDFRPSSKYTMATTGRVSTKSQQEVKEINLAHWEAGLFEVELLDWDHQQKSPSGTDLSRGKFDAHGKHCRGRRGNVFHSFH
jgi:hypothetical protein